MQTATLIIGWYAAKSPLPLSLLPRGKVPRERNCKCTNFVTQGVKNNLQVMLEERLHYVTAAEPEEQWKHMKTILQETTTEVVGLSTRKPQDCFDEADKEIQ